jgi:predicted MarR family transcription regulator
MRGVRVCWRTLREKKFQKKKATVPLYLLLPRCDCVDIVIRVLQNDDIIQNGRAVGCVGVDVQSRHMSSTRCFEVVVISAVKLSQQQLLRCCLHCMAAVSVSDVINFRLDLVIIPRQVSVQK